MYFWKEYTCVKRSAGDTIFYEIHNDFLAFLSTVLTIANPEGKNYLPGMKLHTQCECDIQKLEFFLNPLKLSRNYFYTSYGVHSFNQKLSDIPYEINSTESRENFTNIRDMLLDIPLDGILKMNEEKEGIPLSLISQMNSQIFANTDLAGYNDQNDDDFGLLFDEPEKGFNETMKIIDQLLSTK